jgi:hypothetical protein
MNFQHPNNLYLRVETIKILNENSFYFRCPENHPCLFIRSRLHVSCNPLHHPGIR